MESQKLLILCSERAAPPKTCNFKIFSSDWDLTMEQCREECAEAF